MCLFMFPVSFLSTYWLSGLYPLTWMGINSGVFSFLLVFGLWIILSFFLALPICIWILLVRLDSSKSLFVNSLFGAFAWIACEYLRSWVLALGVYSSEVAYGPHHTYYSLTYLISNIPILKEVVPVGGIYLGSFVIILINFFLYCILFKKDNSKQALYLFLVIFGIVLSSNIYMYSLRSEESGGEINFYIGNSHLPSSKDEETRVQKAELTVDKINQKLLEEDYSNIFILPENLDIYNQFFENKKTFSRDIFAVGSYTSDKEKMFYLDTKTSLAAIYEKKILMPIGEYRVSYFDFLSDMFGETEAFPKIKRGQTDSVMSYGKYDFGSSVCAENISPIIYRDETRSGANILLNISSHSPFGNSRLLNSQTLAINTIRALENGRYFVTAKNYGDSFVIRDDGELEFITDKKTDSLELYKTKAFTKNYLTPYVKFGDYMIFFAFVYFAVYFIYIFESKKRP